MRKTLLPLATMAFALLLESVIALAMPKERANAAFSGINGKIAFDVGDPGQNRDVFVMAADGSNQTNLTSSSIYDSDPAFSPDGAKIAFQSLRNGNLEIYVMDADGSNRVRLTNNQTVDARPAWSPNGTKIAYEGNSDIFVMTADGSNKTNLTKSAATTDYTPVWSPDGTKIAFASDSPDSEIYVMNSDGSSPTNLTNNAATDRFPDWSPDGTKIAFDSLRSGDLFTTVYTMNADGSNQSPLINTNTQSHAGANLSPAWSPDGTKIAYVFHSTDDFVGREVYVVNSDGSSPTNLAKNSLQEDSPNWGVKPPPDTTPPEVLSVSPTGSGVSRGTNVVGTFSEKMDKSTLAKTTFKLYKVTATGPIQITNVTVTSNFNGTKATLNPYGGTSTTLLAKSTKYKAVVTTGVKDLAGNRMATNKVWYFKTAS